MTPLRMHTTRSLTAAPLLLLLAGALLLVGCESDTTAPQDELPALSQQDVAQQTALVAKAAAVVGPEVIQYDGTKNKDLYSRSYFSSGIQGTVYLEYFLGSIGGTPATYDVGDWANLYTDPDPEADFMVALGSDGGSVELTFDIEAFLNRGADTATLGGGGTFSSGDYAGTFVFTDLMVTGTGDYPDGGTLTFTAASYEMVVLYDGDNTAVISVDGVPEYLVNIDNGEITEISLTS